MRLREIALAVTSVVLALLAGEAAVRLLGLGPRFEVVFQEIFELSPDRELEYALRPGAADGDHVINAAGFRDRDFPEHTPPGTFRIVALGDSVTFGLSLPREDSWPKQLERLLEQARTAAAPRFEVLNLGVTGYNVVQVVARLRTLGLRYAPDLVIYGYVLNDPQRESLEGATLHELSQLEERELRSALSALTRGLARSRLFLMLHTLWSRPAARHYDLDEQAKLVEQESREPVDANAIHDRAYTAIALLGADPADWFRALHEKEAARLDRGLAELARLSGDVPLLLAIFPLFDAEPGPYAAADVHEAVAAAARGHTLRVLDLQPSYARVAARFGPAAVMADFLHPSALGQRAAAHALLRGIVEQGLLPAGSVEPARLRRGRGVDRALARSLAAAR